MSESGQGLRVTWVRSAIGRAEEQKRTIAALGLHRLHQTVVHRDTPALRGMVAAVRHLVEMEETGEVPKAKAGRARR